MDKQRPIPFLLRVDVLLISLCLTISYLLYVYYGSAAEGISAPPVIEQPLAAAPAPAEQGAEDDAPHAPVKSAPTVRFLMYNVHDYFVDKDPKRSRHARKTKPVAQREAVAGVIASVRPEVVGLVEIGGPAALEDLAARLTARGLSYPYRRVLARWGEDRALGILSRHPIVADHSVENCTLIGNSSRKMLRGILDVSIQPEGDKRVFRIIGVHLKSRVSEDAQSADALRAREARTVAAHISSILTRNPQAALLVYGDWNDGPKSAALNTFTGSCLGGIHRLSPQDANGETWTIYYKDGQEYNVFDQIYVSSALKKSMGRKSEQGVVSQPGGAAQPSDHRAVWCDMR